MFLGLRLKIKVFHFWHLSQAPEIHIILILGHALNVENWLAVAILYGSLKWTTKPPLLDQEEWETGVINGLLMLKIDRPDILPFCQNGAQENEQEAQ